MTTDLHSDRIRGMSENPFPYRHRVAVLDRWLVDTLREGMVHYRDSLEIQHALASEHGGDTARLTQRICYAEAALEQLEREKGHHAGTRP